MAQVNVIGSNNGELEIIKSTDTPILFMSKIQSSSWSLPANCSTVLYNNMTINTGITITIGLGATLAIE